MPERGVGSVRRWNPPAFTSLWGFSQAVTLSFFIYEMERTVVLPEVQEPCKCGGWVG